MKIISLHEYAITPKYYISGIQKASFPARKLEFADQAKVQ